MKFNNFEAQVSDKVEIGDSSTGTSSSTTYFTKPTYSTEKGWECPRCGRINAPWVRQCDCSSDYPYYEEWWKKITCSPDTFRIHPESDPIYSTGVPHTIHKAPSSICQAESKPEDYSNVTAWANGTTIDSPDNPWNQFKTPTAGGSDYYDTVTKSWVNVPHTLTNMQHDLKDLAEKLQRLDNKEK